MSTAQAANPPSIALYDTLSRTRVPFAPIDPENVRLYVCGPTVYDYAHIGNARPAIVFDVLFRLLRHVYGAGHVTYVRNITDVDDKINARAARDFPGLPLNDAIRRVTETTASQYAGDTAALGCLKPSFEPRATEHVEGMASMAQALIGKGHAYLAVGAEGVEVLFDVTSMPDYGALSRRALEEQQAGARVEVKDHKRNPGDFVLWKESHGGQPGWDAKFAFEGETHLVTGRPGWHIECSVMSEALLGPQFDIHGGGLDLIFPHHENEIAQSRCAHGTSVMANIWMHNGFVQVEGRKMSKSDGNFVTIADLLETETFGGRRWPGEVLRLAMLMTAYREPIDFSVRRLEEAEAKLRDWQRAAERGDPAHAPEPAVVAELADDLNVHRASVVLDLLARRANREPQSNAADCLAGSLALLGFSSRPPVVDADRFEPLVADRLNALAARDFARADALRAELLEQGIKLMDYKDPQTGERRTKWEQA